MAEVMVFCVKFNIIINVCLLLLTLGSDENPKYAGIKKQIIKLHVRNLMLCPFPILNVTVGLAPHLLLWKCYVKEPEPEVPPVVQVRRKQYPVLNAYETHMD